MPSFPFYDLITDYKNHFDTTKYVVEWKFLINEFGLMVYCFKEEMDLDKENEFLNKLNYCWEAINYFQLKEF